jgi:YbbR domain-containing protein
VSLRDATLRHWPLKLAALALSIILWVVVTLEKPDTRLVAIQLDLALAPGLAAAQPLPSVKAIVAGSRRELIKLSAPLAIHATVADSGAGVHRRLAISPSDVQIPRDVKVSVQEVEPREIEIVLDRRAQKTVAVRPVVEPETGYALDGPVRVTPAVVQVSGARSLLGPLDSVATAPLDLKGVEGAFERKVPLDTTGRAVLQIVPPAVTLSGRIKKT